MSTADVFRRIAAALSGAGIPYMLAGSFASSYHGALRSTQDIDIVIAPTAEQLRQLIRLLPESEYYVDLEAALDALRRRSLFNVIDVATGWKIDLIIQKARAFSIEELKRRVAVDLYGIELFVASAEDVVISKLEWARLAESQRQIEDVAGILKMRWDLLDRIYIEKWVRDLGLGAEWIQSCSRAGVSVQKP